MTWTSFNILGRKARVSVVPKGGEAVLSVKDMSPLFEPPPKNPEGSGRQTPQNYCGTHRKRSSWTCAQGRNMDSSLRVLCYSIVIYMIIRRVIII